METIESRLRQFLQMEELSPAKFADSIGIQRSGISHLLAGRNKPSYDFITKMLSAFPELSADWLLTGKGKPYKNSPQSSPAIPAGETLFDRHEIVAEEYLPIEDTDNENIGLFAEDPEPSENPIFDCSSGESAQFSAPESAARTRHIVRVTIFYSDGTYEEK